MNPSSEFTFPDTTYAGLLRALRERLRAGGVPDWDTSAEWLAIDALGCTRTELYGRPNRQADPSQVALLEEWTTRRLRREPVQYIVGYTEFSGLRIGVDPRVLIPRPETELLVEQVAAAAITRPGPVRILDVGTGSGCIALALANLLPQADVWGIDVSEDALDVARSNAEALRLDVLWSRIDILASDALSHTFSIVVSNPPYVPSHQIDGTMPEVASYEPYGALFVDGDPLMFYRSIVECCKKALDGGGHLFFEVNPDLASDVEQLLRDTGDFVATEIVLDLARRERIVWGRKNG